MNSASISVSTTFLSVFPVLLVLVATLVSGCGSEPPSPPVAEKVPVVHTYHGVEVVDNYQWLEDGADENVKAWDRGQNEYTRSVLDAIPCRDKIEEELKRLYVKSSSKYSNFVYVADKLFAKKTQPPADQDLLVRLDSPTDVSGERVIVDPNKLDTTGKTSIDWFVVSPNGEYVAVSLSEGGTEDGHAVVYRVETGEALDDHVPHVNGPTAGGDIAWLPDNSGFFYTHYPREGERPDEDRRFYQQIWFHKLGTPTERDEYVLGKEFPRIAEIEFETSPDGSRIVAVVSDGDGGEYYHWLRQPSGKWEQVTRFEDGITKAEFGYDNSLYLMSNKDADLGKILRLKKGQANLKKARTVVDEGDAVIKGFALTRDNLYVAEMVGGPMRLRVLDNDGTFQKDVPIREVSSVSYLTPLDGNRILYRNSSYLKPNTWYVYNDVEGKPIATEFAEHSVADLSNAEVLRQTAISEDGTEVPMTIIRARGTQLDGTNPTILYGYGGYGISMSPWFHESLGLWLDNGGVYVIANIRGGGEFGEAWHKQGYLTNKQNVFDDFIACAEYLIDNNYTTPERLAIRGGSNGGLLVGAVMVQRPELFKAVVCDKGVLDMLRVELHPNGEFNTTEFGTVTNPEHFEALYAYSPYHNVKDGVDYPDVLFTADVNDGRVDASNSRKMAARLQAADSHPNKILLRVSVGGGHWIGMSKSDMISQGADSWAFLFDRLGVGCDK